MAPSTPTAEHHDQHMPGKLFRSRRERVTAAVVFSVLTAVALLGRPVVELFTH